MDLETIKRFEHYRQSWKIYLTQIKTMISNDCSDARVYVFGSTIKGGTHPTSDIDVLIVSKEFKNIKRRIEIHAKLKLEFLDIPLEFHLIRPEKFPFYKKMAKEMVEV
jgi:predicted nucleotidyltransferase